MQPDPTMPTVRRCRITLKDLAESFDMVSDQMTAFLDLVAGEVLFVNEETARDLERLYESLPASLANAPDEEQRAALRAAIEEAPVILTEEEQILEADVIDRGLGTRYVALPTADSRADYRDMEAFVETVSSRQARNYLESAIDGRGAFRRFRDALMRFPDERERWFKFKQARLEERAREWLADEGIELVAE